MPDSKRQGTLIILLHLLAIIPLLARLVNLNIQHLNPPVDLQFSQVCAEPAQTAEESRSRSSKGTSPNTPDTANRARCTGEWAAQ